MTNTPIALPFRLRGLARAARRAALFAAAAAALLSPGARPALAQEGGIAVGAMAPSAAVFTLDGKPVELASFVGEKPVVLEFWATWCPLCKQLEPAMAAAREQYKGRVRFVSVGVPNNQTPEKQAAFVAERHLGGEFVFDRDSKAVQAFQVPHTSYLVVLDKSGKVVYTGVGGDQNVVAAIGKALEMRGEM
jgi:thiol-disulfide isomerase/thioredoxin